MTTSWSPRRGVGQIGMAFAAACCLRPVPVFGQQPTARSLGPVVATSPLVFRSVTQVVALSDGRVLVNDPLKKQVVLLDGMLGHPTVVVDSVAGRENSYGTSGGTLIAFTADSTLMYNPTARALLVLDPQGKVARVMAPPFIGTGPTSGLPLAMAFSRALGLVYSVNTPTPMCPTIRALPRPGEPDLIVKCEDSATVFKVNLNTHKIDTLFRLRNGSTVNRTVRGEGADNSFRVPELFPFIDAFAVTSDGALAVFDSRAYRVDWLGTDGARTTSPRLSYDWHHVTDDERSRLVDSINSDHTKSYEARLAKWITDSAATAGRNATTTMTLTDASGDAVTRQVIVLRPQLPGPIEPGTIPDFLPPTTRDAVIADADNHIWIHPKPAAGSTSGAVEYDVVDRKGALVDRVQLPAGRTITGFAPGFVFLLARDASVVTLEKVRLR